MNEKLLWAAIILFLVATLWAALQRQQRERDQKRGYIARQAWRRAERYCARHLAAHPEMASLPIQSVFEWLVDIQRESHGLPPMTWDEMDEVEERRS